MMQAELFAQEPIARARATDPETSKLAARILKPQPIEAIVLHYLKVCGPSTTAEISEGTGVALITVSPRMKPLEERGLVVRTAERRAKKIVWRLA